MKKLIAFITILLINIPLFSSEVPESECDKPSKVVDEKYCDASTRPADGGPYRVFCRKRLICQELPNGEKEVIDSEYFWKKSPRYYP